MVFYIIMGILVGLLQLIEGEYPERALLNGLFWPCWLFNQIFK